MEMGAARADLTPDLSDTSGPEAIYLTGFVRRHGPARGVLHPIMARALVAQAHGMRMAVVSLELLELTPDHATALRQRIADELGITMAAVCLCCTHTHYAPAVFPLLECGATSSAYAAMMEQRVLQCAREAAARLRPVRLVQGAAPLAIGLNRRARLREDRGGIDGISPYDPQVRVMGALDSAGRLRAILLHHACHMVSLPPEDNRVSGDAAGVACTRLEQWAGGDAVAMFLNGCAGDINPRDEFKGAPERTERAGSLMADAVREALATARPLSPEAGIHFGAAQVHLPTAPPDPQWHRQLHAVEQSLATPGLDPAGLDARILRARKQFLTYRLAEEASGQFPSAVTSRLQCLRIGGLTLLALSDEVFYEIGQRIIAGTAAERLIWPVGYANGGSGYICTAEAGARGGYEPVESNWFYNRPPLAASAADALVAAGRSLCSTDAPLESSPLTRGEAQGRGLEQETRPAQNSIGSNHA